MADTRDRDSIILHTHRRAKERYWITAAQTPLSLLSLILAASVYFDGVKVPLRLSRVAARSGRRFASRGGTYTSANVFSNALARLTSLSCLRSPRRFASREGT